MTTDRLVPLTRRQLAREIEDLTTERAGVFSVETSERSWLTACRTSTSAPSPASASQPWPNPQEPS